MDMDKMVYDIEESFLMFAYFMSRILIFMILTFLSPIWLPFYIYNKIREWRGTE